MKKINEIIAVFLFLMATVGTVFGIVAIEKYRIRTFYTAELFARSPEKGNWYPNKISIPYNEDIRLIIKNIDAVTHGFAIPDFDVMVSEIKAGNVKVIEFKADKKGTFKYFCTVWCSDNHLEMSGEIVVE